MATNWANTPGPTPGNDKAVRMQKAIAAGATMPASPRRVKVDLPAKPGCTKVPGLAYR